MRAIIGTSEPHYFTSQPWALERSLGPLDKSPNRAIQQDMPVSLTLSNGKVYIGLVVSITDPERTPVMVTILPMYSGYRDAASRIQLTTDYEHVSTGLRDGNAAQLGLSDNWLEQFALAVRAGTIMTVTQFSPTVHAQFNPNWRQQFKPLQEKPVRQELLVEIQRRSRDSNEAPAKPSA
ncbi:MAG TPA: hypothetical protein VHW25_12245 [Steroidobacteraceae bacterium]|nr:hypothetical protein [Steroidobacteraceae bacterium]